MPDEDQDPTESANVRQMRERIKALEEQAKAADEAQTRAAHLERELAIRDAGIDLDPLQRKALFAVHDGEFTADAIRDTALKLGFTQAPPAEPDVPADELARLQRINAASAGAAPAAAPSNLYAERDARLKQARNEAEFDSILREYGTQMVR